MCEWKSCACFRNLPHVPTEGKTLSRALPPDRFRELFSWFSSGLQLESLSQPFMELRFDSKIQWPVCIFLQALWDTTNHPGWLGFMGA